MVPIGEMEMAENQKKIQFKNGNQKILKEQNINVLKIQVYQKIQLKNGGIYKKIGCNEI